MDPSSEDLSQKILDPIKEKRRKQKAAAQQTAVEKIKSDGHQMIFASPNTPQLVKDYVQILYNDLSGWRAEAVKLRLMVEDIAHFKKEAAQKSYYEQKYQQTNRALHELEEANDAGKDDLGELKRRYKVLDQDFALCFFVQSLQKQVQDLDESNKALIKENKAHTRSVNSYVRSNTKLQTQVTSANDELPNLRNQVKTLINERDDAVSDREDAILRADTADGALDLIMSQIRQSSPYTTFQEYNAAAIAQKNSQDTTIDGLRRQIQDLTSDKDQLVLDKQALERQHQGNLEIAGQALHTLQGEKDTADLAHAQEKKNSDSLNEKLVQKFAAIQKELKEFKEEAHDIETAHEATIATLRAIPPVVIEQSSEYQALLKQLQEAQKKCETAEDKVLDLEKAAEDNTAKVAEACFILPSDTTEFKDLETLYKAAEAKIANLEREKGEAEGKVKLMILKSDFDDLQVKADKAAQKVKDIEKEKKDAEKSAESAKGELVELQSSVELVRSRLHEAINYVGTMEWYKMNNTEVCEYIPQSAEYIVHLQGVVEDLKRKLSEKKVIVTTSCSKCTTKRGRAKRDLSHLPWGFKIGSKWVMEFPQGRLEEEGFRDLIWKINQTVKDAEAKVEVKNADISETAADATTSSALSTSSPTVIHTPTDTNHGMQSTSKPSSSSIVPEHDFSSGTLEKEDLASVQLATLETPQNEVAVEATLNATLDLDEGECVYFDALENVQDQGIDARDNVSKFESVTESCSSGPSTPSCMEGGEFKYGTLLLAALCIGYLGMLACATHVGAFPVGGFTNY